MSVAEAESPSGEIDVPKEDQNEDELVIPVSPEEDIKPEFPYMERLIQASSAICMWPNTKKRLPFIYHTRVWLTIFTCISVTLSFAIQIAIDYTNLDSITVLIDFVTVFVSGTFRYVYIYVRSDKYLLLTSLMHNNFIHYSVLSTENRKSIMKYFNQGKVLSLAYCIFTFLWILQILTVPMAVYFWKKSNLPLDSNETLPYPLPMKTYAPFDRNVQPGNAIFYIYQVVGYFLFAWIYVVIDSFWYMVIFLTIGQFALLKDSLNEITIILKKYTSNREVQLLTENQIRKVEEGLKRCVRHHQFIREFVRLIDNISNPNILVDTLHAAISIGFILLDVTIAVSDFAISLKGVDTPGARLFIMNTGDWNKVVYSCEYLITSLAHMFFFDWLGNQLALKEEELAEAVYEIPWYTCPKQKPIFQLMIIQARRPYRLTGGKMFTLSLEFFTAMIKTVFSYFTFLLQLRDGK